MSRRATVIVGASTLVAGLILGSASSGNAEPVVETRTVTQRVEVESVPQSCLDALDAGDKSFAVVGGAFTITAELFALTSDALDAVATFDFAAAERVTQSISTKRGELDELHSQLEVNLTQYADARDECRAA